MSNIKVRIADGLEVVYNNIDTVVLPTTTGEPAVFRKWNGIDTLTSTAHVSCINAVYSSTVPNNPVETTVSVELA